MVGKSLIIFSAVYYSHPLLRLLVQRGLGIGNFLQLNGLRNRCTRLSRMD